MKRRMLITIPGVVFDGTVLELETRQRGGMALCGAGMCEREGRLELLHHNTIFTPELYGCLYQLGKGGLCPVAIWEGSRRPNRDEVRSFLQGLWQAGLYCGAALALVRVGSNMLAYGWMKQGEDFFPVDALSLSGAGMLTMDVRPLWPLRGNKGKTRTARNGPAASRAETGGDRMSGESKLSRLAMFLGEGDMDRGWEIVRKARGIRVAVIGSGRMGAKLILEELVPCEVAADGGLITIDGDILHEPNFDSVVLPPEAVGMPKAFAVECMAKKLNPDARVLPIFATISNRAAIEAVIASDVIISCLDRDAGRVAAAILAALYDRVHLDLAGGTAYTESHDQAVVGEVRLALPGSPPCVAGMGLQQSWDDAIEELNQSAEAEQQRRHANDPHAERPGTCAAVHHSVIGHGMMLFWRLLQGKVKASVWDHLDMNGPRPVWHDWTMLASARTCRACSENGLRGLGDLKLKNG